MGQEIPNPTDSRVNLARNRTSMASYRTQLALDAFGADVLGEAGFDAQMMRHLLERLPERVQEAIDRTAVQVKTLRSVLDVLYTTGERKREAGRTVDLINKLLGTAREEDVRGDDTAGAYPLRRLAEFGLLPGYEFPTEPATLRLLGDEDEPSLIQSGREQGLRQYQPNAPVYARGRRWRIIGVDLSSPWNPSGRQAAWPYARCGKCELIRDFQGHPKCPRCGTAGAAGELLAVAYAGFLARPDNAVVADEEERWGAKDNVQIHPSWDAERVAGRWRLPDGWALEWRRAERIYWLNEGPEQDGVRRRYPLCPDCGKLLDEPPPEPARRKGTRVPARAGAGPDPYKHMPNCPRKGQPVVPVALYAERRVETLRLLFPWPGGPEQQERVRSWAWTLGYSLLAGAERLFALTSRDFEAQFEGMRTRPGPGGDPAQEGILTFIDPNLGGSGYLERFAQRLPEVAAASLHHLDHEGCEAACYRCLKSYDNQRHHDLLSWPLVTSTLEGLREDAPVPVPLEAIDLNDPRPWREAFEAGVGSPLEYRCWVLLQAAGLCPLKQYPIADPTTGRTITISDFAFPDRQVSLYVDGASIHVGEVLRRDRRIEERLRGISPPWTVLRFGRKDIDANPQRTIEKIRSTIG
jgi:very-short-patch-repair endonuclease